MVILQPALLEQKWELKQLDLITEMLVLLCHREEAGVERGPVHPWCTEKSALCS